MPEKFEQLRFKFTRESRTPEELAEEQRRKIEEAQKTEIDDESEKIEDAQLKKYLAKIKAPKGFIVFSRKTKDGLHIYGVEKISREEGDPAKVHIYMGMAMSNALAIKLVTEFAEQRIEATAISRPGLGQSRPVLCYDENLGTELEKPIEEWEMTDAVSAYAEFVLEDGADEIVVVGYSQGALHGLRVACKSRPEIKKLITGASGVAPVKPPVVCRRIADIDVTDDFSETDDHPAHKPREGESPLIFRPVDIPQWSYDYLFKGSKGVPRDIRWINSVLNQGIASYNEVNDYRGENGEITAEEFDLPWIEFCGTRDKEETCAVYQDLPRERTMEYYEKERKKYTLEEDELIKKIEQMRDDTMGSDEEERIELERKRLRLNRKFEKKKRQIIDEKRIDITKTLKAELMKEAEDRVEKVQKKDGKKHRPIPIYENMKRASIGLYYANERAIAHEKKVKEQLESRSDQLKDPSKSSNLSPTISNLPKLTRPNFIHIKLEGASHGDPILKDEYVKIVVNNIAARLRSGFFNRKTKAESEPKSTTAKTKRKVRRHNLILRRGVKATHRFKGIQTTPVKKAVNDSPEANGGNPDDEE